MVEQHISTGADITVMYKPEYITEEDSQHSTLLTVNDDKRIRDVVINSSLSGRHNVNLNVIVMEKNSLIRLINEASSKGMYSF